MATFQPSPDLDPKVAKAIQDAMDSVRSELLAHLKPRAEPAASGSDDSAGLARLEGAIAALDSATTQAGLLASFLEAAGAFADRCLFLVRDGDVLNGWAAFGFSAADEAVARVRVTCPNELAARRPLDNPEAAATICDELAAPQASDSIMVPFSLRGKAAGVLYADGVAGGGEIDRPALRILSYVAAQAVETLPLRRVVDEAALAAPVGEPEVVEPEVVEPEVVAPEIVEPEVADLRVSGEVPDEPAVASVVEAALAPEVMDDVADEPADELDTSAPQPSAPDLDEPDPEVDVDVERMIEEVEPGDFRDRDDVDIVSIRHDVTPPGFESVDEDEVVTDLDPGKLDPATLDTGRFDSAIDEIEKEESQAREELPEATSDDTETLEGDFAHPAGPVEVEPPARVVEGSEVAPPPDLDGPGWAFSGSDSLSEDSRYEEARRLARLLVTEIKLYNEEKVREGRERNDLYAQLRDDIERSRRIYEERIDDEVRQEADYFQEEIVRILAGGDSTALGL